MKIIKKDIWRLLEEGWHIVIPTNGHVNSDGQAVMGRGLAYQCNKLVKGMSIALGKLIKKHGNHVFLFDRQKIITFPTKHFWRDNANLELIQESCVKLRTLMEMNKNIKVAMPKVGCGNGKLNWEQVAPIVQEVLGSKFPQDRFMIVDNESGNCWQEWRGDNPDNIRGKSDKTDTPTIV